MQLHFLGESGLRGSDQEFSFLIDPPKKEITGLNAPRAKSRLVISTKKAQEDFLSSFLEDQGSLAIDHPGEYEVFGMVVYGLETSAGITNYLLGRDGITYCHLGNLEAELSQERLELFEGSDVLIIPVGGNGVLSAKIAHEIISEIEPRLVIPIQYDVPGLKIKRDELKVFLKEFGGQVEGPFPKIKISKKELLSETIRLAVLES